MIQIARIKINGSRSIELLASKKNPSAEHIKIGNFYGELTEDKTKTNGNPTLVFNKSGKKKYIREKFTVQVSKTRLVNGWILHSTGSSGGGGSSVRNEISPNYIDIPWNITEGTLELDGRMDSYWARGVITIENIGNFSFDFGETHGGGSGGSTGTPYFAGSTLKVKNIRKGRYNMSIRFGSSYGSATADIHFDFTGTREE